MAEPEDASRRRRSGAHGSSGAPNARTVALRALRRVTESGAYSNLTLAAELERSRLDVRDRQLAADLLYGTLRRKLQLDRAIAEASARPLEAIDAEALAILRLGVYQVLFSRVPAHAAVSESVNLAAGHHRGFVNAVLRNIARRSPDEPAGEDDESISGRTGLAEWAVAELRRVLPPDEVATAATALASRTDLSIRANACRVRADVLEERLSAEGFTTRRGPHHPDVLRVGSAAPSQLPGYHDGWFVVQDEASVLVAAAVDASPGERILDACAGPGGKTTYLACCAGSAGLVVAGDAHPRRARLVAQVAARLATPARVLVQDARHPAVRGPFDAVLVDAPCSGVGAARRRPELLWRPRREDLARLARLQVSILLGVADLVRPEGRLVYSVCTFPPAETDAAVRAFVAKRPDFEPLSVPGPDGPAPTHRLWPHRHDTDAMFYAGFRRS
ncbi:MAG TPA: 16S rRNA (cytosine(967)-C(5))-methyltransferase RsmB [Actinomycetota bacterium]|nr:16S rRNA (cytosine(967)-C(5))-methyltransferase RsmB [Actinomycetota bacterium]